MGFNTAILINNDEANDIEKNPQKFVTDMMTAFWGFRSGQPNTFRVGSCMNGGMVFHQAHADVTNVFAIGGLNATRLGGLFNGGNHTEEKDQIQLLKQAADELGYKLVKKTKK